MAYGHLGEACVGPVGEASAYASGCFGIFRHHVEVTTSAGTREFQSAYKICDFMDNRGYSLGAGAAVKAFVLFPCSPHKLAVKVEIAVENGFSHSRRMFLHGVEKGKRWPVVEEHTFHYFSENVLGGTCEAGVVQEVAGGIFGVGEQTVREPAHARRLEEAAFCLKEFDALEHSAILVLPSTPCGKKLLKS